MQSICRRHIHKQEKPQPKITEVFLLMTHGMMHKLDIHIYHISDQSELITTEEWIEWPRDIVHKEDRLKCTQVSILGRTGVWQEREKLVFFFLILQSLQGNWTLTHQDAGRCLLTLQNVLWRLKNMESEWWQCQKLPTSNFLFILT